MRGRTVIALISLYSIVVLGGCFLKNKEVSFDGESAYRYLVAQCEFGPRVPNSQAHDLARQFFFHFFDSLGIQILQHEFRVADPYSTDTLRLTNILARFNPDKKKRLLFCAHWDSRPRCEHDPDPAKQNLPLPGANDGASGVAVLMELSRELAASKTDRGVDILLLDGEDWGKSGDLDYYGLGAREFARSADGKLYDYAILLDMVGDKDLLFYKEGFSVRYHPELVDKIWTRAERLGLSSTFDPRVTEEIYDDHVPLLAASIKAIDIIDFEYPWWHTTGDTPDKCSSESLARIGRLMLSLVIDPL